MIPSTREEQKKDAFRLFEDGRYQESLKFCHRLLDTGKDQAIEVLAATNLYYTGRLDDAEVAFLDLVRKMPDSSYVHSYLAKVLEARGDEGAIAEFAVAVHLDPTNQDALRSYADYLIQHKDYRSALRVLRRLVQIGRKAADVRNMMRALIEVGEADEALAAHTVLGEGAEKTPEYIDALTTTQHYRAAADAAYAVYCQTKDPAILRKYLAALSRYDVVSSLDAYADHIGDSPDTEIFFDYILVQKSSGNIPAALDAIHSLIVISGDPAHRLFECDLLAESGQDTQALAAYERLIHDELATKSDLEQLRHIISRYRQFLKMHPHITDAKQRFLDLVSKDMNFASLLETARFYEDLGDSGEARSWYYRAYRADFLSGGLEYAGFLSAQGEDRECEKVMLYILANVRKGSDLTRVAAAIVDKKGRMYHLKRLMDTLIGKLGERQSSLSSDGLELLAMAFFITATNALDEMDYAGCKYFCLCGMDILPTPGRSLRLEDFLQLVRVCKEQSVADRPAMYNKPSRNKADSISMARILTDQLELTDPEQKIVEFLRSHRKATEMDLRKVMGTRRVVGMVNILIRKAAAQGISIIEKKGVGEEGEIYEYTGT